MTQSPRGDHRWTSVPATPQPRWSPSPKVTHIAGTALATIGLVIVGVLTARSGSVLAVVPLTSAAVVLVVGVIAPGAPARLALRFGAFAGNVTVRALFGLIGVLVITSTWTWQRLAGTHPLGLSGWQQRTRAVRRDHHLWAPDTVRRTSAGARPVLAAASLLAIVTTGLVLTPGPRPWRQPPYRPLAFDHDAFGDSPEQPAAYRGASWYPELVEDERWILDERVAWRPLRSVRIADVGTRHVNVTDGVRRSWVAPPCTCARVTVWLYGGSPAFGLGQRDEQTIASAIARAGWEAGSAVDVVNRAQPGDLHWTAAARFAYDLTVLDPPDLVVFYDGADEFRTTERLVEQGRGDADIPFDATTDEVWERLSPPPGGAPPGINRGKHDSPQLAPVELARLAVERYDSSRSMSRSTAAAHELPVVWMWQANRFSRPEVDDEPRHGRSEEADERTKWMTAAASLPTDVVDLGPALTSSRQPHFRDDIHHDEDAATLLGNLAYDHLAPLISSLEER